MEFWQLLHVSDVATENTESLEDIAYMSSLQHFQIWVILAGTIPFNDFVWDMHPRRSTAMTSDKKVEES